MLQQENNFSFSVFSRPIVVKTTQCKKKKKGLEGIEM
jgi:hypothetical protein